MAAADPSKTHSTSAPSAEPGVIHLPPRPAPSEAQTDDLSWLRRGMDRFLVFLVLALAFVLGSFTARNSDLWMHLATGRALLDGSYHFGQDPFGATTEGTYWVNHSWLYDVALYGIYRVAGGTVLVLLKALLVMLLAEILLRLTWKEGSAWIPAVCITLTLLAVGLRLQLQPTLLSYLFLALTLWLLERPRRREAAGPASFRAYWPLPVLFALWVNVDSWFLLGPLTVALYWLGQFLQERYGPDKSLGRGDTSVLGLVLLAGLVACLVNPHHVRAFVLPAQLGLTGAAEVLREKGFFFSPLNPAYFRPGTGLNVGGLTYFVLLGLGLLSFLLNRRDWRWWRVLVWLGLAVVSLIDYRAVPFFAIVAGPIAALNFSAFARRTFGPVPSGETARQWAIAGRFLTGLAGLALLLVAWPGWLQAQPYEAHHWTVDPDPSMLRAAEQLGAWREAGLLGKEDLGFNFSPDAANYFAWVNPREQGFFDHRLQAFPPEAARDFLTVVSGLAADPEAAAEAPLGTRRPDWREVLRRRKVNHVVLYSPEVSSIQRVVSRFLSQPDEWPLLYLKGRVTIFGWRDPARPQATDRFASLRLRLNQQAFHPTSEEKAPLEWPGRDPEPQSWWAAYLHPRPPRPDESDEALLHLIHLKVVAPAYGLQNLASWDAGLAAGIMGLGWSADGTLATPLGRLLPLSIDLAAAYGVVPPKDRPAYSPLLNRLAFRATGSFLARLDEGPPGYPLLVIRAARRAVRANPDDPNAYLMLGEAYFWLGHNSRERDWSRRLPMLERLRKAQAAIALQQALSLRADLPRAHELLVVMFREEGYMDLALKHLKEQIRFTRAAGRPAGEPAPRFAERVAKLEEDAGKLEKEVKDAEVQFDVRSANLQVYERATEAARRGLAGKALDLLYASEPLVIGPAGLRLELELLLTTGRFKDVREGFNPGFREILASFDYHWLLAQLQAASGDYGPADAELEILARPQEQQLFGRYAKLLDARSAASLLVARTMLEGVLQQTAVFWSVLGPFNQLEGTAQLEAALRELQKESDVTMLRALLALECGETETAKDLCQRALALWRSETATELGEGLDFSGRPVAQQVLELLKKN
jgi:hypothetical protein